MLQVAVDRARRRGHLRRLQQADEAELRGGCRIVAIE